MGANATKGDDRDGGEVGDQTIFASSSCKSHSHDRVNLESTAMHRRLPHRTMPLICERARLSCPHGDHVLSTVTRKLDQHMVAALVAT